VVKGIGLILIGFALFALSRPYMEMAAGGDVPPPPPKRWPLRHRVIRLGKRGGSHLRLGFGQLLGLAGIAAGIVIVLH
jgi:hypothetical protein